MSGPLQDHCKTIARLQNELPYNTAAVLLRYLSRKEAEASELVNWNRRADSRGRVLALGNASEGSSEVAAKDSGRLAT